MKDQCSRRGILCANIGPMVWMALTREADFAQDADSIPASTSSGVAYKRWYPTAVAVFY